MNIGLPNNILAIVAVSRNCSRQRNFEVFQRPGIHDGIVVNISCRFLRCRSLQAIIDLWKVTNRFV